MDGVTMVIILAGFVAVAGIGYYCGKAAGRDETLATQEADARAQRQRADALWGAEHEAEPNDAIRACSVCGGPMRRNGAGWEHTIPVAYAQDHRPTLA